MKVRKPMTLSELVKATGKPAEELGTAAVPDVLRGPVEVQLGKRTA
jgi:hypothetical protein